MGCGSSGLKAGLEVEDAGDDADRGVVGGARIAEDVPEDAEGFEAGEDVLDAHAEA